MTRNKIELPIYYGFVEIIKCKNYNKINKELNIDVDNSIEAFAYKKQPHDYVVCFKNTKDISLIVHEVVHLVNFIYIDSNIRKSRTNDEAEAYLFAYLFKKVVKFLKNEKKDKIY